MSFNIFVISIRRQPRTLGRNKDEITRRPHQTCKYRHICTYFCVFICQIKRTDLSLWYQQQMKIGIICGPLSNDTGAQKK